MDDLKCDAVKGYFEIHKKSKLRKHIINFKYDFPLQFETVVEAECPKRAEEIAMMKLRRCVPNARNIITDKLIVMLEE